MSRRLTDAELEALPLQAAFAGRGQWAITKAFTLGDTTVARGDVTDFGSVPLCFAWPIGHPLTGWFAMEAAAHDVDYREGRKSRAQADNDFRQRMSDGLRAEPVRWRRELKRGKAWAMRAMVRLFGGRAWARYRKEGA